MCIYLQFSSLTSTAPFCLPPAPAKGAPTTSVSPLASRLVPRLQGASVQESLVPGHTSYSYSCSV